MKSLLGVVSVVLLLAPAGAGAQDVTGVWDITASFTVPPDTVCEYAGQGISLTQNAGRVSGTVTLDLTAGDTGICAGGMSGELAASIKGMDFSGTLDGGNNLGMATVDGTVSTPASGWATAAALAMSGDSTVTSGPFVDSSGTFSGTQAPAMPTLGPLALGALALLLLGGSSLLLVRRRA